MARARHVSTPKTIAAKEKAALALSARKEGKTYEEIAKEVGYSSRQNAYKAIKTALLEVIREPAEEVIRLELERMDAMWGITYLNAQTGDPQAIASCLKIMDRRAALLGLDAPKQTKIEANVTSVMPTRTKPLEEMSLEEIQQTRKQQTDFVGD